MIEGCRQYSCWICCPRTFYGEVEALWVVLAPAHRVCSMERNNLVPEHVIPGGQGWRNLYSPTVVVGNQHVRAPVAICDGGVEQADLVDLEPLKCGFVNCLAGSVAVCEVVDNRSVMTSRPRSPLQFHFSASLHRCCCLSVGGSDMAVDV